VAMSVATNQDIARIGVRLLDDAYTSWRTAQTECHHALQEWFQVGRCRSEERYFAYCATLEREAMAAADLQRLWHLTESCRALLTVEEPGPEGTGRKASPDDDSAGPTPRTLPQQESW
jgi:hypothetical protein